MPKKKKLLADLAADGMDSELVRTPSLLDDHGGAATATCCPRHRLSSTIIGPDVDMSPPLLWRVRQSCDLLEPEQFPWLGRRH